jgi:diacylglycerol kinase (ATP)
MTAERVERDERRMRVLWNPMSGRKGGIPTNSASRESLLELMAKHGLGDELYEPVSEDEATEAALDAVSQGYDVVVAAGGDGSIGLVGRQLLGTKTALGILPLGSVMNIPRMLGLPRDLEEAAQVLRAGSPRQIDVGRIGESIFYEAGSVGMLAAVSREVTEADEGNYGGILRSLVAAIRYRPSHMTLELDDGQIIETRALLVAIANGPFMGVGFTVAPQASLEDGLFDVRIFLHYSKRELILHFASIAFGRRAYEPRVRSERAARVHISSRRPLPARADSEDIGTTPVTFEIRPRALWVVAPRSPAAAG